VNVADFPAQQ